MAHRVAAGGLRSQRSSSRTRVTVRASFDAGNAICRVFSSTHARTAGTSGRSKEASVIFPFEPTRSDSVRTDRHAKIAARDGEIREAAPHRALDAIDFCGAGHRLLVHRRGRPGSLLGCERCGRFARLFRPRLRRDGRRDVGALAVERDDGARRRRELERRRAAHRTHAHDAFGHGDVGRVAPRSTRKRVP